MRTLVLPQLTGTRVRARQLLDTWDLAEDLEGARIHLDAGDTLAGTEQFADELVRVILIERGADELIISLVGTVLGEQFRAAAERHGAPNRLRLYDGPAPGAYT